MELNIRDLRSFYIVAREGSLSKAAALLTVSQPVLAGQVKRLEDGVGVRLIVEDRDLVRLTRAGGTIFKRALKVFRELDETKTLIGCISSRNKEELRIGCVQEVPALALFEEFKEAHPEMKIIVNHGTEKAMIRSVEVRRNHLALIRTMPIGRKLNMRVVDEGRVTLVAAVSSLHVTGSQISVRDLDHIPLISLKERSHVQDAAMGFLERLRVTPKTVLECSSMALLKELVSRDNGVAFVEKNIVKAELAEHLLKEVRIAEGYPTIATMAVHLKDEELSWSARIFLTFAAMRDNSETASYGEREPRDSVSLEKAEFLRRRPLGMTGRYEIRREPYRAGQTKCTERKAVPNSVGPRERAETRRVVEMAPFEHPVGRKVRESRKSPGVQLTCEIGPFDYHPTDQGVLQEQELP